MATVNFKIKIGCKAAEAENPSQILFKAELKKEEVIIVSLRYKGITHSLLILLISIVFQQ